MPALESKEGYSLLFFWWLLDCRLLHLDLSVLASFVTKVVGVCVCMSVSVSSFLSVCLSVCLSVLVPSDFFLYLFLIPSLIFFLLSLDVTLTALTTRNSETVKQCQWKAMVVVEEVGSFSEVRVSEQNRDRYSSPPGHRVRNLEFYRMCVSTDTLSTSTPFSCSRLTF